MSSRRVTLVSLFAMAVAACDARPVRSSANGSASTSATLATCTHCHGDPAQQNAAPPRGVNGATDTTDPAVGAHQSHLVAGHFRGPVACQECHLVPATVYEQGHIGGAVPATVRFDAPGSTGLASARGASPSVTFGPSDPADPQRRPGATCNVYCHGVTLDGGTRSQPSWAGSYQAGSTTLDCTSCHGFPPGGKHPQNFERTPDAPARACARCHSRTVAADGTLDLAGGKHINGVVDFAGGDACSVCHGDPSRQGVAGSDPLVKASPPQTVTGAAPGAHLAHVNGEGTPLRTPLACAECHAHVADETAATHPDDKVDVDFGPLASASALAPSWDAATGSCAATYCHGATLPGGTHTTPVWTGGSQEARCGACHGIPPPAPHIQTTDCGRCHSGYSATSVNFATHVDGKLDLIALTCSSCHGSATNPAPPAGTHGETDTTSMAVGAHQSHLAAGPFAGPVACGECHVVPTSTSHPNGTVELTFGTIATTGGAVPRFDATAGTCASTYCHGQFAGGNAANAPVWNRVDGSQAKCGSCHSVPPPAPHVQNTSCGNCHSGYSSTTVNAATHVNGSIDVNGMTCTSCHGTPGVNPAPPSGTHGETATSALAVGAHQSHLAGAKVGKAVACSECHVVPNSVTHSNGTVDLSFGSLATTGSAKPAFDPASATCSGTYCHGATLAAGGTLQAPVWTKVDGSQDACGTCHSIPPPTPHIQSTACGNCHPGYTQTSTNLATHIDGKVDVLNMTCHSCHGDGTRVLGAGVDPNGQAAPPVGTHGETATTSLAVGAHQAHLAGGALAAPLACSSCHTVPNSTSHSNGTVDLNWGGVAVTGGAQPSFDAASGTCSNTYCHGAFVGGNALNAPIWNRVDGSQVVCGSCHTIPPSAPHIQSTSCGNCHTGYTSTSVNAATHVNGSVDVGSMTCTSCHGDPSRVLTAGVDSNAKAAPPVDTAGQTASTAVGAHQKHLFGSAIAAPIACAECHTVPTSIPHSNGIVDITWGKTATTGGGASYPVDDGYGTGTIAPNSMAGSPVWTSASATCSSTYCHGNYSGKFSFTFDGAPDSFNYTGKSLAPAWNGGPMTCGSCHAMPPNNAAWHSGTHGNAAGHNDCQLCHPNAVGTITYAGSGTSVTGLAITDLTRHVNGKIDLAPQWGDSCNGCHYGL